MNAPRAALVAELALAEIERMRAQKPAADVELRRAANDAIVMMKLAASTLEKRAPERAAGLWSVCERLERAVRGDPRMQTSPFIAAGEAP